MHDELAAALEKDLGLSPFASELSHITPCIWDIDHSLENVEKVITPKVSSYLVYER